MRKVKRKSTMQWVKKGKYDIVQTSSNFIRIMGVNGGFSNVVIQCTKRLPKRKLKKLSKLAEACEGLEPKSLEYEIILRQGATDEES